MPVECGKICCLCLVHTEIKIIAPVRRACLGTGITSHALVIHISRIQLHRHIKIAFLALDFFNLCKGIKFDVRDCS